MPRRIVHGRRHDLAADPGRPLGPPAPAGRFGGVAVAPSLGFGRGAGVASPRRLVHHGTVTGRR